jgi:hypothetical protein
MAVGAVDGDGQDVGGEAGEFFVAVAEGGDLRGTDEVKLSG